MGLPVSATPDLNLIWETFDSLSGTSRIHDHRYREAWERICFLAHQGAALERLPQGFKLIHHEAISAKFVGGEWTIVDYNKELTVAIGNTAKEALVSFFNSFFNLEVGTEV